MEELRLQLAERVPGAMRLAASSMGMTMADFEEAVRDRTINAGEFLENFSQKLKDTFGIAAQLASQRLFADIQRLGNAFTAFRQQIFVAGFEEGLRNMVRAATQFLTGNPELANVLGRFSKGIFDRIATFLDSLSADRVVGMLNQLIGAFEMFINAMSILVFKIQSFFNDDLEQITEKSELQLRTLSTLIEQRDTLADKMARGVAFQTDPFTGLEIERPASDIEKRLQSEKFARLTDDVISMREEVSLTNNELLNLGATITGLPDNVFDSTTGARTAPSRVSLPRIEVDPPTEGSILDLSNQEIGIPAVPPAVFNALDLADSLSREMPDFFAAVAAGDIRDGMDELARVTLDLNVLLDAQAIAMDGILERQKEIDRIRSLPEAEVNAEKLNNLIREQGAATDEFLLAEEDKFELMKKQNDELERRDQLLAKSKSFQKSLEETFISVQDAIFNSIKKTEDAFVDLVATGKASFSDLAEAIIRDLARIAIQAFLTRYVLGPLLQGPTQTTGDQLGGTLSTEQGITPGAFEVHTGGVVGLDRLQARAGFSQLRNNEQPIVVQKGEGIFTQEQMRAMAPISKLAEISRSSNARMTPAINVTPILNVAPAQTKVEVINNTSEEATVTKETAGDGSELIQVIVGAVGQDIAQDGQISRIMKGKFGLKNQTGLR
jgi:hypothetical protein